MARFFSTPRAGIAASLGLTVLFVALTSAGIAEASKSRGRARKDTVSRSDWGVSFRIPKPFKVSTSQERLIVLESGAMNVIVRPANVASIREARVHAKRGVHGHGFMLDAEELPEELRVNGHNAAAVPVSGTDRGGNQVEGRVVTIDGPSSRGLQVVAVGPAQAQEEVLQALDAVMQSLDFAPAAAPTKRARRRGR